MICLSGSCAEEKKTLMQSRVDCVIWRDELKLASDQLRTRIGAFVEMLNG